MMEDQLDRGNKGFGAIYIDNKGKFKIIRACHQTKTLIDNHFNPSQMVIMHHRWPTSSDNQISQTHPIIIDNGSLKHGYLIIHNGVIRNDKELKTQHEKDGFKYTTDDQEDKRFNDSECLAIEVAKFIEGQTKIIGIIGSCAFIAAQFNKKTKTITKIFYGRDNTNPLKLAKNRSILYLTSASKGENIKPNTLYSFNIKNFTISKNKLEFAKATPETITVTGFKNEDDTTLDWRDKTTTERHYTTLKDDLSDDIDDYQTAETVDANKEAIVEELDELYEEIIHSKTLWNLDIDKRIRMLASSMIQEVKNSYLIASEYFANEVVKQMEEEQEKTAEEAAEIETQKEIEEYNTNSDIPNKYFSH